MRNKKMRITIKKYEEFNFYNSRQNFRDQNFWTVKFRTAALSKNYSVRKFWKLIYAGLNCCVGVETEFHG